MTKCEKSPNGKHEFEYEVVEFPGCARTGDAPELDEVWVCKYCGLSLDEEEECSSWD